MPSQFAIPSFRTLVSALHFVLAVDTSGGANSRPEVPPASTGARVPVQAEGKWAVSGPTQGLNDQSSPGAYSVLSLCSSAHCYGFRYQTRSLSQEALGLLEANDARRQLC